MNKRVPQSARGLAQSKTLARDSAALKTGEAFGLRQSFGAFTSLSVHINLIAL